MAFHSTFSLWPQTMRLKVGNKNRSWEKARMGHVVTPASSSLVRFPACRDALIHSLSRACLRAETLSVIHGFLHFKDEETDTIQRQSDSGAGSLSLREVKLKAGGASFRPPATLLSPEPRTGPSSSPFQSSSIHTSRF